MDVLESIFTRALKLESPWKITRIEFNDSEGRIARKTESYRLKCRGRATQRISPFYLNRLR